jgi:CubicO group peptidase (beta-lactamase class C family)
MATRLPISVIAADRESDYSDLESKRVTRLHGRVRSSMKGLATRGLQRLDDWVTAEIEQDRTSGAVISIVCGQQHEYLESKGYQNRSRGVAMRQDSIFCIASMTKPLVATAALMLMEQGALALSDPLDRYLPQYKSMQVGAESIDASGMRRLSLEPAHRAITIQDLLRHTSGLTTSLLGNSAIRQQYRDIDIRDPQQNNAELADKLAQLPLMHQPGTVFEYGMSTDVLGRVIEIVSGVDLNQFLMERICTPLGMRDTSFLLGEGNDARLAVAADGANGGSVLSGYDSARPPKWYSGGSGALSTASDFTRFCQMLLFGGELGEARILSPKSVALMCNDHLPLGSGVGPNTRDLGITAPLPEYGQGYGLGVGVRLQAGLSPVPGSIGDFYWGGALGTYFWVDPQQRLIAILMMQELDPNKRARYRSLFRNLVYAALVETHSS